MTVNINFLFENANFIALNNFFSLGPVQNSEYKNRFHVWLNLFILNFTTLKEINNNNNFYKKKKRKPYF